MQKRRKKNDHVVQVHVFDLIPVFFDLKDRFNGVAYARTIAAIAGVPVGGVLDVVGVDILTSRPRHSDTQDIVKAFAAAERDIRIRYRDMSGKRNMAKQMARLQKRVV